MKISFALRIFKDWIGLHFPWLTRCKGGKFCEVAANKKQMQVFFGVGLQRWIIRLIQLNTDLYLKLKKCRSGKSCRWRPFNVWPLAEGSRWASVTFVLMSERRRCPYKARFRLPRGGEGFVSRTGRKVPEKVPERGKQTRGRDWWGNSPELSFQCI